MTRVEELLFNDHTIRLAQLENRWWVFCDDAAPQIDPHLSPDKLFVNAPEEERRIVNIGSDSFAQLVSAQHLLQLLRKHDSMNDNRMRAWLRTWKIISEAAAWRE